MIEEDISIIFELLSMDVGTHMYPPPHTHKRKVGRREGGENASALCLATVAFRIVSWASAVDVIPVGHL